MKNKKTDLLILGGIFLVGIIIAMGVVVYKIAEDKSLLDGFCQEVGGIRMTDYRKISGDFRFKCEGKGDTIFASSIRFCQEDEWGQTFCEVAKPNGPRGAIRECQWGDCRYQWRQEY